MAVLLLLIAGLITLVMLNQKASSRTPALEANTGVAADTDPEAIARTTFPQTSTAGAPAGVSAPPAGSIASSGSNAAQHPTDSGGKHADGAGAVETDVNATGSAAALAEGNLHNPAGAPTPENVDNSCQVGIAVVGRQGQILFGPATVTLIPDNKWGLTVMGALDVTGLKYSMSPVYGSLVLDIAGQQNKGMCGWMYEVNGEPAMRAAGEKEVKTGDNITWWYSEDITKPAPSWKDLTAAEGDLNSNLQ